MRIVAAWLVTGLVAMSPPPVAAQTQDDRSGPPAVSAALDPLFDKALQDAVGAPGQVILAGEASLRLSGEDFFIPPAAAEPLLQASDRTAPPDMLGLFTSARWGDVSGPVRFIPAGFIDADAIQGWSADDLLASLRATLVRTNTDREKQDLPPLEARQWVQPPHYDPATHQFVWGALVVPRDTPREAGGAVVYNAVAFGRSGYLQLTVASSEENATIVEALTAAFLGGVRFLPGKAYTDAPTAAPKVEHGLEQVMGIDHFQRATTLTSLLASDLLFPITGGVMAAIGSLALCIYIMRRMRREARRS